MAVGAGIGWVGCERNNSSVSSQNSQVAKCASMAWASSEAIPASHCHNDSFVGQARVLAKREVTDIDNPDEELTLEHNRPASTKITTITEGKHS